MSKEFYEKYGDTPISKEEMRQWCSRPGKVDEDGKPVYVTEQAHKDECDINKIIKKFDKTGLLTHVSKMEAKFGDIPAADFKTAMDIVAGSQTMFKQLPVEIRNEFKNDPYELVKFMDDENNRDRAIELGLIREDWDPSVDGIGEHVIRDENLEVTPESPAQEPPEQA